MSSPPDKQPASGAGNPPAGPRIVWLASYPRSGGTWLRFLIANLLVKDIRSSRQVAAMIPEIDSTAGRKLALSPRHRSLVATRWPYDPANELFGLTAGFICVVRNPRDVMRSLFAFNRTEYVSEDASESGTAAWRRYAAGFIAARGHPVPGRSDGVSDWIRHVKSWRRAADTVPGLFVRYEDLVADTPREMDRICAFLRARPPARTIDAAVAKSSFAAMKAMEAREVTAKAQGIFYGADHEHLLAQGVRVLGPGPQGDDKGDDDGDDGAPTLPADQAAAFRDAFGAAMADLGYTLDSNTGDLAVAATPLGDGTVLPAGPDLAAARVGRPAPQPVPDDQADAP
jgi:hypothetical protein